MPVPALTVHKPTNSAASTASTGSICAATACKRLITTCCLDARATETGFSEKAGVDEMSLGGTAGSYIANCLWLFQPKRKPYAARAWRRRGAAA